MINELDLERSVADYCLYHRWIGDKLFISINWVDDIILACPDESVVLDKKKKLEETFEIDDVGPMTEFVSCHIDHDRSKSTMKFLQPVLLQSFVDEFELPARATGGTLAPPGVSLRAYEDEEQLSVTQKREFRKAIGKLWYLARMSRHDILHAVRDMSRFSSSAWTTTWKAVLQR
jgi:Reverse transcriptase (RNA-dependent DNA polymerase)